MSKILLALKIFINILLYIFYVFISMFFGGFIYGYFVTKILHKEVPLDGNIVFMKLGIFIMIIVFVFTILLRKFFYLSIFRKK